MLQRSPKQKILAVGSSETLRDFLSRTLTPADVDFFAAAFEDAAARYDRYFACKHEWSNYADRKRRLTKITGLASALASNLSELDTMSRDELASRSDPKEIKTLIGSLNILGEQVSDLIRHAQSSGRSRDLAEQRWIEEVADIYENAFGQPASANWTAFSRVLQLKLPSSLARYGKLDLRQIKRAMQRRREATPARQQ
jgi:hypothetical protein